MGPLAAIAGAIIFILAIESAFRISYFIKHEKTYEMVPKVPFEKICIEPHPYLQKRFPDKEIEVNNSGVGGYTSAEVMIQFLLTTVDAEPDVVVLYHSCNDIMASLTPGFKSDYSHARKNLAEEYNKYKTLSKIPYIPLAFYNHAMFPEMVNSLTHSVTRGKADYQMDFQGEQTYKRNIEHLIHICKANDIKMVLSTFCRYPHEETKGCASFQKLFQGISRENVIMSELAQKHSLPLVDSNNLIPREEKYFLDHIHFSPLGMEMLAQHISQPIIQHLSQLQQYSDPLQGRFS